nr:hypothetical protein [Microbacterium barkeri]
MRFVWAVVAFVLAAALIGAGIAQRTIFVGPDSQKTEVAIDEPAPFVLLDGDVLRINPGAQTLIVRGDGEIFGSYGRTADMEAWLADSDYNHVTVDDDGDLNVEHVTAPTGEDEAQGGDDPTTEGTEGDAAEEEPTGRDPRGSDLWLDSFGEENLLTADNMQLPEGTSLLIAYDGTKDAPDDIVVSWPLDNSTPWAGPLMVAGGVVLLIGLILYVLAIRHQRRAVRPERFRSLDHLRAAGDRADRRRGAPAGGTRGHRAAGDRRRGAARRAERRWRGDRRGGDRGRRQGHRGEALPAGGPSGPAAAHARPPRSRTDRDPRCGLLGRFLAAAR